MALLILANLWAFNCETTVPTKNSDLKVPPVFYIRIAIHRRPKAVLKMLWLKLASTLTTPNWLFLTRYIGPLSNNNCSSWQSNFYLYSFDYYISVKNSPENDDCGIHIIGIRPSRRMQQTCVAATLENMAACVCHFSPTVCVTL